MAEENRVTDREGGYSVQLPEGWTAEPDAEHGGLVLSAAPEVGSLHLLGFPPPTDEWPDPAEELFAFLDEEGVDLEEDEVEDLEIPNGEAALCEYVTETEDEGADVEAERTYWLAAVAVVPEALVFASYACEAGEEEGEREAVRRILASVRPAAR